MDERGRGENFISSPKSFVVAYSAEANESKQRKMVNPQLNEKTFKLSKWEETLSALQVNAFPQFVFGRKIQLPISYSLFLPPHR